MDEATLDRQLAALEPPEIDVARHQAMKTVGDRVVGASAVRSREVGQLRARAAGVTAVCCAGFFAFAVWTAPGQAVTGWVGDRLGFGEPGGPPTLEELRTSWNQGTAAEGQPAYVVVSGPAPHAGRYELITYKPKEGQGLGSLRNGGPCFELNLTQERSSTGQGCGVLPEGGALYSNGFGGGFSRSGEETVYTSGRVSMEVESVDAYFNGQPVEVELVPVPMDLLDRLEIERPFKFFIAFLPEGVRGGPLAISARDQDGNVLSRKDSIVPDLAGSPGYIPGRSPAQR